MLTFWIFTLIINIGLIHFIVLALLDWPSDRRRKYDPATGSHGLFSEYVNMFVKLKTQASGYPAKVCTEADKEAYVTDYATSEGINLDPSKIAHNAGFRSMAKLMLNSLCKYIYFSPHLHLK